MSLQNPTRSPTSRGGALTAVLALVVMGALGCAPIDPASEQASEQVPQAAKPGSGTDDGTGNCGEGTLCIYDHHCCAGLACKDNKCEPACNYPGYPCCNGTCGNGLACDSGGICRRVDCGYLDQPCCDGGTCSDGTACVDGICSLDVSATRCGGPGQACCKGGTCNNGSMCGGGGLCVACGRDNQPVCPDSILNSQKERCRHGFVETLLFEYGLWWHPPDFHCRRCGGLGELCCGGWGRNGWCNAGLECQGMGMCGASIDDYAWPTRFEVTSHLPGEVISNRRPTFVWTPSYDANGVVYSVEIYAESGSLGYIGRPRLRLRTTDLTTTQYTVPSDLANGTYSVRISAMDPKGYTTQADFRGERGLPDSLRNWIVPTPLTLVVAAP